MIFFFPVVEEGSMASIEEEVDDVASTPSS